MRDRRSSRMAVHMALNLLGIVRNLETSTASGSGVGARVPPDQ
jgi:hypothetical protein